MSDFKYFGIHQDFDRQLAEHINDLKKESALRAAERRMENSSGIDRVAKEKTPLEVVQEILAKKQEKSKTSSLAEVAVRMRMKERAVEIDELIDNFLKSGQDD